MKMKKVKEMEMMKTQERNKSNQVKNLKWLVKKKKKYTTNWIHEIYT